jgi:hypothetical protein
MNTLSNSLKIIQIGVNLILVKCATDYLSIKKKESDALNEMNSHLKTMISQKANDYNRKMTERFHNRKYLK